MLAVEIYTDDEDNGRADDVLAGTITLDGGKLSAHPEAGYAVLLKNILADSIMVNGREVKPSEPEAWIRGLHREYKSYQLWATEAIETQQN